MAEGNEKHFENAGSDDELIADIKNRGKKFQKREIVPDTYRKKGVSPLTRLKRSIVPLGFALSTAVSATTVAEGQRVAKMEEAQRITLLADFKDYEAEQADPTKIILDLQTANLLKLPVDGISYDENNGLTITTKAQKGRIDENLAQKVSGWTTINNEEAYYKQKIVVSENELDIEVDIAGTESDLNTSGNEMLPNGFASLEKAIDLKTGNTLSASIIDDQSAIDASQVATGVYTYPGTSNFKGIQAIFNRALSNCPKVT